MPATPGTVGACAAVDQVVPAAGCVRGFHGGRLPARVTASTGLVGPAPAGAGEWPRCGGRGRGERGQLSVSGMSVSASASRTGPYMRALMVPTVGPALVVAAAARSTAVVRTASSATAWSTMPAAWASRPP